MISRGKHRDCFLYEITEQDLLLKTEAVAVYRIGNVLIFPDKKSVVLGNELAKADDIFAAKEYLDDDNPQALAITQRFETEIETLQEKIAQRDELLRDLADTLRSQKSENEALTHQLHDSQMMIATAEQSRNEMVDDLQQVSVDTQMMEAGLQRALEEKARLEAELAFRLTEVVELNLENSELSRQLQQEAVASGATPPPSSAIATKDPAETTQVLTMTSGRQVHVYHEFSTASRPNLTGRFLAAFRLASRVVMIAVFALVLLSVSSVLATAATNHISLGEALDVLLKGSLGA